MYKIGIFLHIKYIIMCLITPCASSHPESSKHMIRRWSRNPRKSILQFNVHHLVMTSNTLTLSVITLMFNDVCYLCINLSATNLYHTQLWWIDWLVLKRYRLKGKVMWLCLWLVGGGMKIIICWCAMACMEICVIGAWSFDL